MSYNRQYPFSEEKFDRWTKEGRGTGTKADYLSWLTEADLPARFGHKTRYICAVTGRRGIAFSTTESRARLYYEAVAGVEDIREQFPLDREITRSIAKELGIDHPRDPASKVDIVMTTDLVISYRMPNGDLVEMPRSCKMDNKLDDFNQAEHAEIERRYWLLKKSNWRFVTNSERCMPPQLIANLTLLLQWRFPPEAAVQPFAGHFDGLCERLVSAVLSYRGAATLAAFGSQYQADCGLGPGEAVSALLHLIFRHRLRADLAGSPLMDQRVTDIGAATLARRDSSGRRAA